jgi:hypothetical protein
MLDTARGVRTVHLFSYEELFLNNLLLENGHARRYDKVSLADWEEESPPNSMRACRDGRKHSG